MIKLAVFHNGVMDTAVHVSCSRTPYYKTQADFCRQSSHKALVKYSSIHSEAAPLPSFSLPALLFQLPWHASREKKKKPPHPHPKWTPSELRNDLKSRGTPLIYSVIDWPRGGKLKEKYPHALCLKHGYACNESTNSDEGITMPWLCNGCIRV